MAPTTTAPTTTAAAAVVTTTASSGLMCYNYVNGFTSATTSCTGGQCMVLIYFNLFKVEIFIHKINI